MKGVPAIPQDTAPHGAAPYGTAPRSSALSRCALIELPKIYDVRGSLTVLEGSRHIPFEIRRVYYLYDVPGGAVRAGHAHLALQQCLIAVAGSFDVTLDDAFERRRFTLNRPSQALLIPPMLWRDLDNFSSGSVCLSLASEPYDEADYVRDYGRFLAMGRTNPGAAVAGGAGGTGA